MSRYDQEMRERLPVADFKTKTTIRSTTLCQVIDVLDIETSLSIQIERLEAKQRSIHLLPDDEDSGTNKFSKYVVRDSHANNLILIFHTAPPVLPQLGTYLLVKSGCELHRGILIGKPQTVQVLDWKDKISVDRLQVLKDLKQASENLST